MNDSAASMLASAGHAFAHKIDKIDYSFDPGSPGQSAGAAGKIQVGEKCWRASVFPFLLNDGQEGFLFLPEAEDILKLVDFDTFLNSIDAAIVITDQNGMLEHINDSLSRLLGVGVREWVGRNVQECIDQKVLTDSVSLKVLRAKKPISMNVSYGAGVTIHYKSVPIMDGHGEVRKVISTGRDVTRLINLEKDLSSSETLKDQYYQRLNTLEVLLGGERIVYSSEPMRKVVQVAIKAGKFDTPVFLWGESGVGKEMAARLIHQSGIRSPGPFVGVNCSAVPSELLESEFFGYADGAFTGARKGGQKGLFDEAEGGTLFLDEITELSLTMQSKLLRVIQEREFMRVGGRKRIRTDARIIASTNLSWEELTEGSGFRRDLFYRLSVIPIQIPPLRDRRDDILPLIRFFLTMLNQKYKTNIKIAHSLLPRLYNYDWPGNVRELKNVIERLIVVAGEDEVGEEEFELLNQLDVVKPSDLKEDVSVNRLMPLQEAREKLEQILFKRAYQEGGSIEKAAELLQINPSTIYRKIKKGRLQPP
ncbi:sigma-54 interaction domain-containing protein [Desulfatibacillum aliphaticivorans]|nr:sigma 54-interacting transcriptional regulator [Desulfatibacillum aliphaticivorans]